MKSAKALQMWLFVVGVTPLKLLIVLGVKMSTSKRFNLAYKNGEYCKSLGGFTNNPYSRTKGQMLEHCAWAAGYGGY
jgi:hypothetical protein